MDENAPKVIVRESSFETYAHGIAYILQTLNRTASAAGTTTSHQDVLPVYVIAAALIILLGIKVYNIAAKHNNGNFTRVPQAV